MVGVAYVDTSAFVKLYDAAEPGAEALRLRLRATKAAASVLLLPEAMSAVARKLRLKQIDADAARRLRGAIGRDFQNVLKVRLGVPVLREAERLLFSHPLRSSDAIHLASALVLGRTREEPSQFLTADRALADAAVSEGLDVERFGL